MSTGLERARERHTGTPAEQRDRGIAQAVREIDEMRAENTKLLGIVDRYRQERDEALADYERLRGHLQFAIDVVHSEARYQWEQDLRGIVCAQVVAQRMIVVETVIRNAVGG